MPDPAVPFSVGPGEGTTIEGPAGGPLTFKARGDQTNGALTVVENVVAPNDGPPLHTHANEDEFWYILEGTFRFKLGGEIHDAPQGSFVFVPRGTPHNFQNIGHQPARILAMFTPAGMENFFDRFAELPAESTGPEAFKIAGQPVGMEIAGPPLAVSDPQ
ncbi:MAG TPA: cupin domain-containing protein [Solirubrobacterales bacterium]|jgi:quercetin dioxygenase-like cupin family protein|nr:cupin domain-containing protein [Solirubrobacterales bacterium]